jgi:hypothetical protein
LNERAQFSSALKLSAVLFIVPVKVFDRPVICFLAGSREETAGNFSVSAVIGYTFAAFAAPRTRI